LLLLLDDFSVGAYKLLLVYVLFVCVGTGSLLFADCFSISPLYSVFLNKFVKHSWSFDIWYIYIASLKKSLFSGYKLSRASFADENMLRCWTIFYKLYALFKFLIDICNMKIHCLALIFKSLDSLFTKIWNDIRNKDWVTMYI